MKNYEIEYKDCIGMRIMMEVEGTNERQAIMNLQKELIKERFKMEKAKAAQDGKIEFLFDGKVYKTGMTLAKVKQQEDDRGKLLQ